MQAVQRGFAKPGGAGAGPGRRKTTLSPPQTVTYIMRDVIDYPELTVTA